MLLYNVSKRWKLNVLLKQKEICFWSVCNVFLWGTAIIQPVNLLWHMGSYVCFPVRYGYMIVFFLVCFIKELQGYYCDENLDEKNGYVKKTIKYIIICTLLTGAIALVAIYEADIVGGFLSLAISNTQIKETFIVLLILSFIFISTVLAGVMGNKFKILFFLIVAVVSYCYFNMISLPITFREKQELTYQHMTAEYCEPENQNFGSLIQRQKHNPNYPRNAALINGRSSMSGYFPTAEADFQESMDKLGYMTPWVSTIDIGGTKISDYYFNHIFVLPKSDVYFGFDKNKPLENQKTLAKALFSNEVSEKELEMLFSILVGKTSLEIQNRSTLYMDVGTLYQELEVMVNGSKIEIPMKNMQDSSHVLLCLGTFETGTIEIMLKTADGEMYSAENVKIGLLDENLWADVIEKTQNEFDTSKIKLQSRGFCCELEVFDLPQEGVLILPINATEGWKARIDGTETNIIEIGECFIGIDIESNSSSMKLKFQPPLMSVSYGLCSMGILMLVALSWIENKKTFLNNEKIQSVVNVMYMIMFWGAFVAVYLVPTLGLLIHMGVRVINLVV